MSTLEIRLLIAPISGLVVQLKRSGILLQTRGVVMLCSNSKLMLMHDKRGRTMPHIQPRTSFVERSFLPYSIRLRLCSFSVQTYEIRNGRFTPKAGVGTKDDTVRPGLIQSANYTRTRYPQTLKELITFMVQKLVRRSSFFDTCLSVCFVCLSVCLSAGLILLYSGSYWSSSVVYCSNTHLSVAMEDRFRYSTLGQNYRWWWWWYSTLCQNYRLVSHCNTVTTSHFFSLYTMDPAVAKPSYLLLIHVHYDPPYP